MILSWHKDANSQIKKEWKLLQKEIEFTNDKLRDNYIGIDPNSFLDFNIVLSDNNEIEAFAAVQDKECWNGFKRIATRLYIRPRFRKSVQEGSSLNQYTKKTSYTALLIDYQYNNYSNDCIFLSRECTFRSFERFIERFDLKNKFIVADGLYRVCGIDSVNPKCIQKIAVTRNSMSHLNKLDHLIYETQQNT